MRQIHGAIEHVYRGDYECAITLASAAEGMLAEPDEAYLRHRVKDLSTQESLIPPAGNERLAAGPNSQSDGKGANGIAAQFRWSFSARVT